MCRYGGRFSVLQLSYPVQNSHNSSSDDKRIIFPFWCPEYVSELIFRTKKLNKRHTWTFSITWKDAESKNSSFYFYRNVVESSSNIPDLNRGWSRIVYDVLFTIVFTSNYISSATLVLPETSVLCIGLSHNTVPITTEPLLNTRLLQ